MCPVLAVYNHGRSPVVLSLDDKLRLLHTETTRVRLASIILICTVWLHESECLMVAVGGQCEKLRSRRNCGRNHLKHPSTNNNFLSLHQTAHLEDNSSRVSAYTGNDDASSFTQMGSGPQQRAPCQTQERIKYP
jgi:hypothetical protein